MAPQDPYPPHPDPTGSTIDTPPEPERPGMLASRADTDTPAWPAPTASPLGLGHDSGGPIPLAFLGRTSTVEHQDPTLSIPTDTYGHLTAEDARRVLEGAGFLAGTEVRW